MKPVVWHDAALDELADIWVAATPEERDEIEAAIKQFEARVRRDPDDVGESRSGNRRVAFQGPLAIDFEVDALGVRVTHVRWKRKRR